MRRSGKWTFLDSHEVLPALALSASAGAPFGCVSPARWEWFGSEMAGCGPLPGIPAAPRRSSGGVKSAIVSKTFKAFHPPEGGT